MIIEAREDTITLRGAITANIWPAIQAAAALLLENHPTGIILDCSALTNCTSKGAETFADAFRYIQTRNARIVVTGLSPELAEVGQAVPGVRSQVPLAASVEDARASLKLEEITPQTGKARVRGLVPMLGDWKRAIYHADRLAMGENCELHLVDLIKVPRTLPIGSPLPEREAAGQERIEAAKALLAQARVRSFGHVERVRAESAGLVEFAGQIDADLAVVSLDCGERGGPHIEETEAMSLLESAGFEVSLIKGAPAEHSAQPTNVVVPATGAWEHAVEHTCKLTHDSEAAVTVLYLISIPRAEPIDAKRPDAEVAASDCAKEAARIGKRYGVSVSVDVQRVRDPILGFMRLVGERKFDLAVVGVRHETTGDYHIAHSIATALLQELPCETVFLRVGEQIVA